MESTCAVIFCDINKSDCNIITLLLTGIIIVKGMKTICSVDCTKVRNITFRRVIKKL